MSHRDILEGPMRNNGAEHHVRTLKRRQITVDQGETSPTGAKEWRDRVRSATLGVIEGVALAHSWVASHVFVQAQMKRDFKVKCFYEH